MAIPNQDLLARQFFPALKGRPAHPLVRARPGHGVRADETQGRRPLLGVGIEPGLTEHHRARRGTGTITAGEARKGRRIHRLSDARIPPSVEHETALLNTGDEGACPGHGSEPCCIASTAS